MFEIFTIMFSDFIDMFPFMLALYILFDLIGALLFNKK